MMKQQKPYKSLRQILTLLLAMALVLTCTGCADTLSFTASNSDKLAAVSVPERATSGQMWYTFPFTAEQANTVFFGDADCQLSDWGGGYESLGNESGKHSVWYFFTEQNSAEPYMSEYYSSKPEAVLGGAHNLYRMNFYFLDKQYRSLDTGFRSCGIAFEPEAGELLEAITYHPVNDAVYDHTRADSAAKLKALGYTNTTEIFSSRIDWRAMRILGRALGNPLEDDEFPSHYYVIRYSLQTAELPTTWSDALQTNNMATATFHYTADGALLTASISTLPEHQVTESVDVRYTAQEAFALLPDEWNREDCILVDSYLEPVRSARGSEVYADCWTFRFVAPPEQFQTSDTQLASTMEILGIAGRYMEMQCHVNVHTGEVTGGQWRYSKHLIHEYNNKNVLTNQQTTG